jgi:Domain of unknown function (DUF4402)
MRQCLIGLVGMALGCSTCAQSLYATQDLAFGTFAVLAAGSVTVLPSGARVAQGSVVTVNAAAAHAPAVFEVVGPAGHAYSVSLPSDHTVWLTSGPGQSVPLSGFRIEGNNLLVIGPGGRSVIQLGATLNAPSAMPPGSYRGSFSLTINHE